MECKWVEEFVFRKKRRSRCSIIFFCFVEQMVIQIAESKQYFNPSCVLVAKLVLCCIGIYKKLNIPKIAQKNKSYSWCNSCFFVLFLENSVSCDMPYSISLSREIVPRQKNRVGFAVFFLLTNYAVMLGSVSNDRDVSG